MLAKDVKIKTVARQAGYIKMKLKVLKAIEECDAQFIYKGHIFPEVKEKLKRDENVSIYSEMRKGIPITFFTVEDVQRKYIENKLIGRAEAEDGDPTYVYLGHISEDNLEYFRNEGYITICAMRPEEDLPIVIFLPDDEKLTLTPQELFMSTEFNQYDDSDSDEEIEKFKEFTEWVKCKIDGGDDSDE